MNSKAKYCRAPAVAARLFAGAALSLLLAATSAHAQGQTTVRYIIALPAMLLVTANQTSIPTLLGFYAEEGLKIEATAAGQGGVSVATQLVASGKQDVGSGTHSAIMARAAEGKDLGLSFFYNQIRDFHYVIGTLPNSGVKTMADLKGKQIGVDTLATEGAVIARYFARTAGLDPDRDVTLVAIGRGAQALQAIQSGQVAAISNLEAAFAPMIAAGQEFAFLPLPAGTEKVFGPGLFARREYIEANRKVLVGLGRAVAKSTLFMLHNPEAAVRLHWKMFPEMKPQGIPEEKALKEALNTLRLQSKGYAFLADEPQLFGRYRPESWHAYLKVYGLSSKIPNPELFYTNALVEEMNNFDRQKIIDMAKSYRVN